MTNDITPIDVEAIVDEFHDQIWEMALDLGVERCRGSRLSDLNRRLTADINAAHRRAYLADDLLAVQAADAFESWDRAWRLRR